jgi:hypothetical protein
MRVLRLFSIVFFLAVVSTSTEVLQAGPWCGNPFTCPESPRAACDEQATFQCGAPCVYDLFVYECRNENEEETACVPNGPGCFCYLYCYWNCYC